MTIINMVGGGGASIVISDSIALTKLSSISSGYGGTSAGSTYMISKQPSELTNNPPTMDFIGLTDSQNTMLTGIQDYSVGGMRSMSTWMFDATTLNNKVADLINGLGTITDTTLLNALKDVPVGTKCDMEFNLIATGLTSSTSGGFLTTVSDELLNSGSVGSATGTIGADGISIDTRTTNLPFTESTRVGSTSTNFPGVNLHVFLSKLEIKPSVTNL